MTVARRRQRAPPRLNANARPLYAGGALRLDQVETLAHFIRDNIRPSPQLEPLLEGRLLCRRLPALDEREVLLSVAANSVFVAVIFGADRFTSHQVLNDLRDDIEQMIADVRAEISTPPLRAFPPGGWGGKGGAGGAGPAQLPLVEWGVTVRRRSRN